MRLDSVFHAYNQCIQLAKTLLFEMWLKNEVINVFEDSLNQFGCVLADYVSGAFPRLFQEVCLKHIY